MFQIEVKMNLIAHEFHPAEERQVHVDLDAMELPTGGTHPQDKHGIAERCRLWLEKADVVIGSHPIYGRTDVVAVRGASTYLVEVEGDSSRQPEQALHSTLGQTILMMTHLTSSRVFALAVPHAPHWERQLRKVPATVCKALNLRLYLVSKDGTRDIA